MDSQQNARTVTERRKYPRIETENDVSYVLFNADREVIDQGKGKALDLSQSGTLLETEKPLNGSFVILMTLDLEGKKVKVQGRVANIRKSDKPGCYRTGIEFVGSRDEQIEAIVAFVKAYNRRKQRDRNKQLYSVKSSGDIGNT
ncbi:MAG: PilZ domain-containing protein [Desulfobacteraceae bacterium]|nr:PilZ domain-containing protein [Desulfobacteraceae bacterium]